MCGLFGVINFKPKRINKPMLNVLGITNDMRGGDSCGLFIDGDVEYGFGKTAKYIDFLYESSLLKEKDYARIILGHCRKASVGGVTLDKAQPTVHRNENGDIDFVVIHNGTIRNHDELAKKYIPEVNTFTWSDSQIMTAIFYKCGYDVLQEYTGGSVFVIADYRGEEPKVMVFQGVSKEKTYDTKPKEERPFFYTRLGDSYVFCSVWHYLVPFAPGDEHQCYIVPENTLIELTQEEIKPIKKYDRSDKVQDPYVYKNPTTGTCHTTVTGTHTTTTNKSTLQLNTVMSPAPGTMVYDCSTDKYKFGNEIAHGTFSLDITGIAKVAENVPKYYFWEGVILYNNLCYDFLISVMQKKNMTSNELLAQHPDLVHYLSPYPWHNPKEAYYDMMINYTYWNNTPYSGELVRIFDLYKRVYKSGKQVGQDLFAGFLQGHDAFPESNGVNFETIEKFFLK